MPTNRSNPNQNAGDGTGQGLDMAASTTHLALVPTWVPLAGDTAGSASGSDGQNISSGGDGYATGVVASTPTAKAISVAVGTAHPLTASEPWFTSK